MAFPSAEAAARLKRFGPNAIAREGRPSIIAELWGRAMNPLNALLLALAVISYFLSDARSAIVIAIMVVLSIVLGFIQEHRSNNAAAKLAAMIKTRASVKRGSGQDHPPTPGTCPRIFSRSRSTNWCPETRCGCPPAT